MSTHAEQLPRYTPLRDRHLAIGMRIMRAATRDEVCRAAGAIGLLAGGSVLLSEEDDSDRLAERLIYHTWRNGLRLVDQARALIPGDWSAEDAAMLAAMASAPLALLHVADVEIGVGFTASDRWSGCERFIFAPQASRSLASGTHAIARLIAIEDLAFPTPLIVPLSEEVVQRLIDLRDADGNTVPARPGPEQDQLLAMLHHVGLGRGMPDRSFRHATPKTGRNQPCPCGSGRKFKRCCGA